MSNDILKITTAYEQGVGKGHQSMTRGEISNPYSDSDCKEAWQLGYEEGKLQSERQSTISRSGRSFHLDFEEWYDAQPDGRIQPYDVWAAATRNTITRCRSLCKEEVERNVMRVHANIRTCQAAREAATSCANAIDNLNNLIG